MIFLLNFLRKTSLQQKKCQYRKWFYLSLWKKIFLSNPLANQFSSTKRIKTHRKWTTFLKYQSEINFKLQTFFLDANRQLSILALCKISIVYPTKMAPFSLLENVDSNYLLKQYINCKALHLQLPNCAPRHLKHPRLHSKLTGTVGYF